MATHGKKSRCLIDGYSMTNVARGLGVSLMKETADCTVIEVENKEYEAGQKGGRYSVSAIYKGQEQTVKDSLSTSIASDSTHLVAFAPAGFTVGADVLFGEAHQASASSVGDNKSVVSVSLAYEATGGIGKGLVMVSPFV